MTPLMPLMPDKRIHDDDMMISGRDDYYSILRRLPAADYAAVTLLLANLSPLC